MTRRATKFTPEVLLSAPRRSPGIPNADGSKILYSISSYSFKTFSRSSEIQILNVETKETVTVTSIDGASEPNWIDDSQVLLLVPGKKGTTEVHIGDAKGWDKSKYVAGVIDGAAGNLKLKKTPSGYIFALSAPAKPDGSMYNAEEAPKRKTTGLLYDSNFVRHWDTYVTPIRNTIWYGEMLGGKNSKYPEYHLTRLTNALVGSKLESPIPPFGGADDFDISLHGLALVAKDPNLDPSTHTKQNLYVVIWPRHDEEQPPKLHKIGLEQSKGATSNPKFSHEGHSLAFLSMYEDGYEADRNDLYMIQDIRDLEIGQGDLHGGNRPVKASLKGWDRSASGITWSRCDNSVYITADDVGNVGLFELALGSADFYPNPVVSDGAISGVKVLDDGRLFISGSTLIDSSIYYAINPLDTPGVYSKTGISSLSQSGKTFGLSDEQYSHFFYQGEHSNIGAWMVKPSSFDPDKKYPLAYLIHGGPQGSWENAWSTRWNPAIFAEQGYVVVCPNPTGSTGYGQALTDAIQLQWGGKPYLDLVRGIDHIEAAFPFVDMDRAVALGASYGGYMVNWIQGHELGRRFKALVTHDGVFSMAGQLASEEQYFPAHEFGGRTWSQDREAWLRWDPAAHTDKWATPHLVVHSEKDYRLTISEGLSAFNVLQQRRVPSRFLAFPDENHWVLKPENSLLWHAAVLGWINRFAGLPDYPEEDNTVVRGLLEEAQMSL